MLFFFPSKQSRNFRKASKFRFVFLFCFFLPKLLAKRAGFGGMFSATEGEPATGGHSARQPVLLGTFQEALFSYVNAFVDPIDLLTSKSVQLITASGGPITCFQG